MLKVITNLSRYELCGAHACMTGHNWSASNQLLGELRNALKTTVGEAGDECDVLTLNPAKITKGTKRP